MMKKRLFALLMCVTLLLALAACNSKTGSDSPAESPSAESVATRPPVETLESEVEFCLEVIHSDGTTMTTYVTTDKATLGEALLSNGLIGGKVGAYGLFVTIVDDEKADESKEQWWCLTKDGESVNTGVDYTPVEADATYTFTLTEGY